MYATEFKTIIKDSHINIPEFEKFKNKEVRVIVIDISEKIETNTNKNDFISRVIKEPKHIKANDNFLSREEANER